MRNVTLRSARQNHCSQVRRPDLLFLRNLGAVKRKFKPFFLSVSLVFSVPCVPTDVTVVIDCSKNEANVTWSASDGALSYKASALSTQGSTSLCETTDLSCTLTNLTCGHSYMVQVVAQDNICSSLPSPAKTFQSGRTKTT